MEFDLPSNRLIALGDRMVREAEAGNWEQVSRLHASIHEGLVGLFEAGNPLLETTAGDLLERLQAINEQVARAASRERANCYDALRRLRQGIEAQQSYTACGATVVPFPGLAGSAG